MSDELFRGQIGFIPGMGCLVNQIRAIERIKIRTENGRIVYGLFTNFSNAYNTILHSKLFKSLGEVLTEEKVNYLKALYSRNMVKLGAHSFKPNIGVAQGSVISPALFNIYIADLLKKIEAESISQEDILAYADDILVLCTSKSELKKVLTLIRGWSKENNLFMNPKKSGIVPFQQRQGRDVIPFDLFTYETRVNKKGRECKVKVQKPCEFDGIPVVAKYKYLGLWLEYRLSLSDQIELVEEKSKYLGNKLYGVLVHCSLETRRNLWMLLCRPLVEQAFALYVTEPSESNRAAVETLTRRTFRKLTLLSGRTDLETIERLMDYDVNERGSSAVSAAKSKWIKRKNFERITEEDRRSINKGTKDKSRGLLPKEVVEYANILTARCPLCRMDEKEFVMAKVEHLSSYHGIELIHPVKLVEELEKIIVTEKISSRRREIDRVNRKKTIEARANVVKEHIDRIKSYSVRI